MTLLNDMKSLTSIHQTARNTLLRVVALRLNSTRAGTLRDDTLRVDPARDTTDGIMAVRHVTGTVGTIGLETLGIHLSLLPRDHPQHTDANSMVSISQSQMDP